MVDMTCAGKAAVQARITGLPISSLAFLHLSIEAIFNRISTE
jgi:hypothetical protein